MSNEILLEESFKFFNIDQSKNIISKLLNSRCNYTVLVSKQL